MKSHKEQEQNECPKIFDVGTSYDYYNLHRGLRKHEGRGPVFGGCTISIGSKCNDKILLDVEQSDKFDPGKHSYTLDNGVLSGSNDAYFQVIDYYVIQINCQDTK